jgi:hypothetical protein
VTNPWQTAVLGLAANGSCEINEIQAGFIKAAGATSSNLCDVPNKASKGWHQCGALVAPQTKLNQGLRVRPHFMVLSDVVYGAVRDG